jgi:nitrite reductase/ring-hydroxylating ferredoxin subunit
MESRPVAILDQLEKTRTLKFHFQKEGIDREGFLVWFDGQVRAYENVCRHIPITLDFGDGQFLSRDGKMVICQTHGATYDPLTGYCVWGPCAGASLKPLKIELRGRDIFLVEPGVQLR